MEFHPLQNQAPPASPATLAESASQSDARFWARHPGTPDRSAQRPLTLSKAQLESFDRDGFLLIRAKDVWSESELKLMIASVNQMDQWPDKAGEYMKYYEANRHDPNGPKIVCRIENFTQYNPGLDFLLQGDKLPAMCTDLFNEASIMYKEKVNYKLPGSAGFAPHQDVAAGWWMYKQTLHISCLVSIDPATVENGCLEVAAGEHRTGMMSDDWKEIPLDKVEKLKWQMVPTEPGDVLFFDSYVPHRSAENNTNNPRRVLYATYAKQSEGDFRNRYYADKRAAFPPDIERAPGTKYEYKI